MGKVKLLIDGIGLVLYSNEAVSEVVAANFIVSPSIATRERLGNQRALQKFVHCIRGSI